MQNRSRSTRSSAPSGFAPGLVRATSEGTARYAKRSQAAFTDGFYRAFHSDLTVSSIGIGTYLGEASDEVDTQYEESIRAAVRSGANLIDTAINYRCQRSERVVGAALREMVASNECARDEIVISTKGGYIPLDIAPPASREAYRDYVRREFIEPEILREEEIVAGGHSLAPRFLRYCLARSRQNLGLRTIDVYYVHNPGQQLANVERDELERRMEAAFGMLEEAVERGEIGAYGVATWNELRAAPGAPEHLSLESLAGLARKVAGDGHHLKVIQLPFNLAMPEAVRTATQVVGGRTLTVLEAASELGLHVVGSATLMQSRLATALPDEVRKHFPAARTAAQAAIEFSRVAPGLTSALVGMKHPAHVAENLEAVRRQ